MSDTPPDRKEAGDAPEGRRNPWMSWLVWLILAPVLYVLSAGPAARLHREGMWREPIEAVYLPLSYLPEPIDEALEEYIRWWRPSVRHPPISTSR